MILEKEHQLWKSLTLFQEVSFILFTKYKYFLSMLFLSQKLAFYDPPSNKFCNQTDAKMFMYLSNCTKFSTSRIFWHREQFHSWVQLLSGKVMHNFKLDSWYFTPFDCQNHVQIIMLSKYLIFQIEHFLSQSILKTISMSKML